MIGLDQRVQHWIVVHRLGWLDPVLQAVTWAGTFGAVFLVLGLALALLRRRRAPAAAVVAAVVLGDLAARVLQAAVGRDRPPLRTPLPAPLVDLPNSGSFPSGHATVAFAAATVLALALPRGAVPLLALAAAVAFSRVYVGVHYPLDVLASAALGVGIGLGVALAAARRPWGRHERAG